MNDRNVDQLLAAWIEHGPTVAPDRVSVEARREIRRTPQSAGPGLWLAQQYADMNTLARVGVAMAIVAVVTLVGISLSSAPLPGDPGPSSIPTESPVESPSPSPSASERPSPSPGFSRFTSTIHGISIDYPAGWQIRRATEPWTEGELNFDSPAADVIFHPTLGKRLYIALASRPSGSTQFDQIDLLAKTRVCEEGGGGGSFAVDGASAFDWYCGNYKVAVTTGSRGYLILVVVASGEPGLRETYDFDWIQAELLETVDLRPQEAVR
jgi:hypothetical protein